MRRRVVYRGRVQGVGFRATAHRVASGLAISGWVRNQPDGSVHLEVQGSASDVETCIRGISDAMARNIRSVESVDLPDGPPEDGFEVRS